MVNKDNLIPIIFGITGHRDLIEEDIDTLRKIVLEKFIETSREYPCSPIILLTPLAEGADRLAARAALEFNTLNLGKTIDIIVPLPMPMEEYKKDFASKEAIEEFHFLLGKSREYFELGFVEGNNPENIKTYGRNRDKQYEQVGVYIAKHSQTLIALWDGVKKDAVGGTSKIVEFKCLGEPLDYIEEKINPLEPIERWPVYHILTPRKSNPDVAGTKYEAKYIYPTHKDIETGTQKELKNEIDSKYKEMLGNIEKYNRDIINIIPKKSHDIRISKSYVFNNDEMLKLLSEDEKKLLNDYAIADTLSNHFQKKRIFALKILTFLVLAVALFFAFYKKTSSTVMLGLYFAALVAGFGLYFIFDKKEYQDKHQDYRALAEGLRVQLFWNIAGINRDAAAYYLKKHKSHLEWIRNVIRICSISKPDSDKFEKGKLELVGSQWILDQMKYFERTPKKYNKKIKEWGKWAKVLSWSVPVVAFVVLIVYLFPQLNLKSVAKNWLIPLTAFLPPFSAAIYNYINKMSYKELAGQYIRMYDIFNISYLLFKKYMNDGSADQIRELIFNLGIEALNENGDWVLLNSYKPMDKPVK